MSSLEDCLCFCVSGSVMWMKMILNISLRFPFRLPHKEWTSKHTGHSLGVGGVYAVCVLFFKVTLKSFSRD